MIMKPKLLVSVVLPLVVYAFASCEVEKSIGIQYDTSSPLLTYGVDKLKKSFSEQGYTIRSDDLNNSKYNVHILIGDSAVAAGNNEFISDHFLDIEPEGYKIISKVDDIYIIGVHDSKA